MRKKSQLPCLNFFSVGIGLPFFANHAKNLINDHFSDYYESFCKLALDYINVIVCVTCLCCQNTSSNTKTVYIYSINQH